MARENPARASRQAFFALFVIIVTAVVIFLTLPLNTAVVFAPFALVGVIGTVAVGCIRAEEARKRSKMERGEGVVAKWSLHGADWREFVKLNEGALAIPHRESETMAAFTPVEVIFAEDAVYIDGEYHTMDRNWNTTATFESPYTYVELTQGGLETITPLRIPVPPSSLMDAERVVRHFNTRT
jgi:hypothetical protein